MAGSLLHYPKTLGEFRKVFSSEQSCIQYLIQSRWPEGFHCDECAGDSYWFLDKRRKLVCRNCRKEITPTSGTLMHRHGGCRRLLNRERGDLGVAQQLLGNSSLKTTLVYAKRDAGALTSVVQKDWEDQLKNTDIGCKWLLKKPQDQNESHLQEVAN
jgi:integrase